MRKSSQTAQAATTTRLPARIKTQGIKLSASLGTHSMLHDSTCPPKLTNVNVCLQEIREAGAGRKTFLLETKLQRQPGVFLLATPQACVSIISRSPAKRSKQLFVSTTVLLLYEYYTFVEARVLCKCVCVCVQSRMWAGQPIDEQEERGGRVSPDPPGPACYHSAWTERGGGKRAHPQN